MCAALGLLPNQGSKAIAFAWEPAVMSMNKKRGVFGQCQGFTDATCVPPWLGFANGDIYYLEVGA